MVHPAWGLLVACLALTACGEPPAPMTATPPVTVAPPPPMPQGPRPVALLLPLTGPNAAIAQSLLHAAQLAASTPGAPQLDVRDTGGDPAQAATQAQQAIDAGDALILGPLTAGETAAVAQVSQPANVAVLSFSSDPNAASPGVWTLGITPAQQIRRLVAAAHAEGHTHLAALLPEGPFGDALQTAFANAATDQGLEPPAIQRESSADPDSADNALKQLADYDHRNGDLQDRIKAMRNSTDPATRQQAAVLAAQPAPPPPFDVLLLADNNDALGRIADLLPHYDVVTPQVRVIGPAYWSASANHFPKLAGAWYAVPDPSQRDGFINAFQARFGAAPPPLADIAFDAALIARALAQEHDTSMNALTKPDGFSGVDGAMVLLPDGQVRRALAIYQIGTNGSATIVSAAPSDLTSPGS